VEGPPAETGEPEAADGQQAAESLPPATGKAPPPRPAAPPAVAPGKDMKAKAEDLSDSSTVRIDVKRIDDLMNQVGELVLERNRMLQLDSDLRGGVDMNRFSEEFGKLAKRLNFVTSEVQMQVLKIRMIPVEKVFKKFPRNWGKRWNCTSSAKRPNWIAR